MYSLFSNKTNNDYSSGKYLEKMTVNTIYMPDTCCCHGYLLRTSDIRDYSQLCLCYYAWYCKHEDIAGCSINDTDVL